MISICSDNIPPIYDILLSNLGIHYRLSMQRTKKDIHTLIQKGETFHLECKKAQGGLPGSIWEYCSAFCNTDGGGTDEQQWARPFLQEDFRYDQTTLTVPTVDLTEVSPITGVLGVTGNVTGKLTPIQVRILDVIKSDAFVSQDEVADKLKISRRTVIRQMADMGNVLRRVGPKKDGHCEIVKPQNKTESAGGAT